MQDIYENLTESQATLIGAVLSSAGVFYRADKVRGKWRVRVRHTDIPAARNAMASYHLENENNDTQNRTIRFAVSFVDAVPASLLIILHAAINFYDKKRLFVDNFGASASRIMDGGVYRTLTALMLHGDSAHLAGNVVGITLFGAAAARIAGWGIGWLCIVLCGGIGNLINAYVHESGHVSIGASTAVFAAIGILSGAQFQLKTGGWRSWAPIGAGFALMALLGSGPDSDVLAHAFGFLAGIPGGWALARGKAVLDNLGNAAQAACALLAILLMAVAFLIGARM